MELLLVIGAIWFVVWLGRTIYGFFNPPAAPASHRYFSPGQSPPPPREDVYRPKPPKKKPTIKFGDPPTSAPSAPDLADLRDAFTGAPLNPALGLHQCTACQVYYHTESLEVLREANSSQCVACGATSIVSRGAQEARTTRGRNYDPDVVTLANFRSHFNHVVTFEGKVREIKVSKRGKDYAVMFENASWSKGLKLVFFRRSIPDAGGIAFIKSMKGKHVRVRGLLIDHKFFGPEIIITDRNMILDVG